MNLPFLCATEVAQMVVSYYVKSTPAPCHNQRVYYSPLVYILVEPATVSKELYSVHRYHVPEQVILCLFDGIADI